MRKRATPPRPASTPVSAPAVGPLPPVWLLAAFLAVATVALYWPAMRCGFINCDDPAYVTANLHVQGGLTWEGVKWAFSNTQQAAYWAPLTWLSQELACQLFGLNPWGHHLINVLLHAANTVLVFLLFRRMTGAPGRSLILAAFFAWHPLRVESVAWIAECKDVLSAFFGLLTLWFYVRFTQAPSGNRKLRIGNYAPALFFFACSLMSKATLVTLPCVLLLLDYWPLERFKQARIGQLVVEKIPFFILAAAASVVTFVVQQQGGAVATFQGLPLEARVGNALISYCRYLGKMFWPGNLAIFYPLPAHQPLDEVLVAGAFLCAISLVFILVRRQYPFLLVGWLWFVGTLVPMIQLVQSGEQAMADRFTYVPSLGLLLLVVWGAYELSRGWRCPTIALPAVSSLTIVLCLALTRRQLGYWRDSETIFRHAIEVTQNNYFAHDNLGMALIDQGQTGEAIRQYQEAIRLNPNEVHPHYNLGIALLKQDQVDAAINQFQEAIRLNPNDAEVHNNLGVAFLKKGRPEAAIGQFQAAVRLQPDYVPAHNNLAVSLFKEGQTGAAIRQFQEAVRLNPNDPKARRNLARAIGLLKKSTAPSGSANP